jgi:tetratricopeptide (TPR) repeat protein
MAYRSPSQAPLPMDGTLAELGFSEVLLRAARERKTAVLELTGPNYAKSFLFRGGVICASQSNIAAESLAKLLIVRGKTTREVLEGLGVPLLNDGAVGELVQLKGGVAKADVDEVVRYQLVLRAAEVFPRQDIAFTWKPFTALGLEVSINPYQLFLEGVARRINPAKLDAEIEGLVGRVAEPHKFPIFELHTQALAPRAQQLHRAVDGRKTYDALANLDVDRVAPEQREQALFRSWVYLLAFVEGGYLAATEPKAQPAHAEPTAVDVPEGAVVVFSGGTAVTYTEVEDPALTQRFEQIQGITYFEVLGIGPDATDAQAKKAYFKLAKEFHPDRVYDHEARTVKKYADKIFAVVNTAYQELKTAQGRAGYQKRLDELSQGIDLNKEAEALLQSEMAFQKGVVYYRKRDFANALAQFQDAYSLNPREADHHVYLGYLLFQKAYPGDQGTWQEGVALVKKAIELDKNNVDGPLFLGNIHKVLGDIDQAEAMYKKVVQLRPHHVEALRELRLIEQRRVKGGDAKDKKSKTS